MSVNWLRLLLITGNALAFAESVPLFITDNNAFTMGDVITTQDPICGDYALWGTLFAQWASQSDLYFHTQGISLGYERFCDQWIYGIAAAYTRDHYHHHHHGKARIVSIGVAPYVSLQLCPLTIDAKLLYVYNRIRDKADLNFHTNQLMPQLGLSYATCTCGMTLKPYALFDWVFNYCSGTSSMLRSEVGLNISRAWNIFLLEVKGGYINKAPFHMPFPNQNLGTWGLSATLQNAYGFFGMLSYNGEAGSGYLSNLVELTVGKDF